MAEYRTEDVELGISSTPETTYNQIKVLGSDFLGFVMTGRGFPLPDREYFDDTGKIGNKREFPRFAQRSGYVLPPSMEISDTVNTDIAAVLFRRCLGGTDLATPDSQTGLAAPGSAPTGTPSTTGGTLAAGAYTLSYAYTNYAGEGVTSAASSAITVASGTTGSIAVTAVTPLPAGASGVNWYLSIAPGSTERRLVNQNNGAAFTITKVPNANARLEPGTGATAGTTYGHYWQMLPNDSASGRQLPSSSVVYNLGGIDYVWGGCVIESMQFQLQGAGEPTFTANLLGSGLYKRISEISPSFGTVPQPAEPNYMLGAETELEFTNASGTVALTHSQRLLNFTLTVNNNHRTDARRAGDKRVVQTNIKRGWYVNRMLHQTRTVTADMTVMLDENIREILDAQDDVVITGFKFRMKGYYIGSSTINQYTFEIVVPKCNFRQPRFVDDNGDAAVQLSIFPIEDTSGYGLVSAHIINGVSTTIV